MPDSKEHDHVLREVDRTCTRIQIFARGIRMADSGNDTELADLLLDEIQHEFECGAGYISHELHDLPGAAISTPLDKPRATVRNRGQQGRLAGFRQDRRDGHGCYQADGGYPRDHW